MKLPIITLCVLTSVLSGCANKPANDGAYLELKNTHVIYRDLSSFTPTTITRTDSTVLTSKPKAVYQFNVKQGERYQVALKRWLRQAGFRNVAWSLDESNAAVLDGYTSEKITYQGSLKKAINQLSDHLNIPIKLIHDKKAGVIGVYDFSEQARITHVAGKSLKLVVQHLVENYGYRWDSNDGFSRSWLAHDDYQFGADYYLLTKRDDIETALDTVLADFPVYSSIVESTSQILIQENIQ
ncbi:hypothetical protein ACP6H1_27265 [Vibrio harveyi]|uniref:hypothetical protein n=1 Tax=Vibrio harveyi TaxID=669 RepID=UPI003CF76976